MINILRYSIKNSLFLMGVIFVSITTADEVSTQESPQSEANQCYIQYLSDKNEGGISNQTAKVWIEKFETVLPSSNTDDPAYHHVLFALAELHDILNEKDISEKLYSQVFYSEKAPKLLRVLAGENFFSLVRMQGRTLSLDDEKFFLTFDSLVNNLEEKEKTLFLPTLLLNRILWTDVILDTQRKVLEQLLHENLDHEAFGLMRDSYIQIDKMLSNSLEEYPLLNKEQKENLSHLNFGIDNTFFHLGSVRYELGLIYEKYNQKDESLLQFDSAQKVLHDLLKCCGKNSLFAARAVVLSLKIQKKCHGADNQYFLQNVKKLIAFVQESNVIQSMHLVLNYLLDEAMLLSRDGSRDIASALYDIIIDQEKKCFPNEYKGHVNYQLALAANASNSAEIGDRNKYQQNINELNSCDVSDPSTKKVITDWVEHSNERIQITDFAFDVQNSRSNLLFIFSGIILIILAIFLLWTKKRKKTPEDNH
ncbi:MAG: hypothetical protein LBG80_08185 [Bacteroidales bacterium]|nr:hypothetical protein [Bacteroidales bacterium]